MVGLDWLMLEVSSGRSTGGGEAGVDGELTAARRLSWGDVFLVKKLRNSLLLRAAGTEGSAETENRDCSCLLLALGRSCSYVNKP